MLHVLSIAAIRGHTFNGWEWGSLLDAAGYTQHVTFAQVAETFGADAAFSIVDYFDHSNDDFQKKINTVLRRLMARASIRVPDSGCDARAADTVAGYAAGIAGSAAAAAAAAVTVGHGDDLVSVYDDAFVEGVNAERLKQRADIIEVFGAD